MKPFVSIIVPTRNEKDYIYNCLESLFVQDYPKHLTEILVVDGMSYDGTTGIIKSLGWDFVINSDFIKLIYNPCKTTPHAFNIGINYAKGELIMICGAHSIYPKHYVSMCVEVSRETGAENVGGSIDVINNGNQFMTALISKFGVGKCHGKNMERLQEVDTVFGGCYRQEVFKKIGLFNTDLTHTQDLEFNYRLRKAGGKIILCHHIWSYWHPRAQTWKAFAKKAFIDGQWVILPVLYCETPITLRHLVPLAFVLTLPLSIWPYTVLNLINSRKYRPWYSLSMAFFTLHMCYGAGSLYGCFKVIKEWMKRALSRSMSPGVAY